MIPTYVRLRPASAADADAAAELLAAAGLVALGPDAQFGPNYVLAEDGEGRIVGMAGIEVHGDSGLLRSVVVSPSARARGLGAELTRERIEWARRRGLRALYLLTTTAVDYFPRLGFEVIPRDSVPPEIAASEEWRSACPASAVAMRHRIVD